MEKECSKCGIEKELNEFQKRKDSIDGHRGICSLCTNERVNLSRRNNRAKYNEKSRQWRLKNPEAQKAITSRNYHKDILRTRAIKIRSGGKYRKTLNGQIKIRYISMHSRCYSTSVHSRQPTYIGCSVHQDWHRDNPSGFENFKAWALLNGFDKRLELDKDGIVNGNKVYGPDTCQFITKEENMKIRNF